MEQLAIAWGPVRQTFTVTELSQRIRDVLGAEFKDIWISGEISGTRPASSGHCYFTLKDTGAQLKCVCWRSSFRYMRFKPQDGIAVIARGRIDVYEGRGEYQFIVETLEPQGHGALQFAFDQLKRKLSAEGLFEAARKRPLPKFPNRIGLVTSRSGAVIQDIVNVLSRRFPGLHLRLFPALVQGDGAVESVCRGLDHFSQSGWAQVVILARGGGSLEDLWTFNEEALARRIAASRVPVISAIGHETDFTIADFVADLRAPTPSAAAELVICTREEIYSSLHALEGKLRQHARYRFAMASRQLHQQGADRAIAVLHRRIGRAAQKIDELDYCLRDRIRTLLTTRGKALDLHHARLKSLDLRLRLGAAQRRMERSKERLHMRIEAAAAGKTMQLERMQAHLTQLDPTKILERGYAIVSTLPGHIVKQPDDAPPDTAVDIRVAKGRLRARIER